MSRSRRILVVAYSYPPQPAPGSNRWEAMCAYLEALGYEVVVLTTSAFGAGGPPHRETIRTRDAMRAPGVRRFVPPQTTSANGPSRRQAAARQLVRRLAVPDARALTWLPSVAVHARRLIAGRRFDCIITSSPPHSTHLVALLLGRSRPPWIAEFRDGWRFEPHTPAFPTRLQRGTDWWLERSVVESADRVIAATRPIAADLSERFGVEPRWIPNGWDPRLEDGVTESTAPSVRADRFTLVHTGSLSNAPRRDPGALFEAIARIVESDPRTASRLELVLAGPLSDSDARLLGATNLDDVVRYVGFVPRSAAVALQRRADALVLLAGEGVSPATSKLAEYLAAELPIVVLGRSSEAARVVAETGTGVVVDADDPVAIEGVLRRAVVGGLPNVSSVPRPEEFRYPLPAEWLAEEIESLIGAGCATG